MIYIKNNIILIIKMAKIIETVLILTLVLGSSVHSFSPNKYFISLTFVYLGKHINSLIEVNYDSLRILFPLKMAILNIEILI